MRRFADAAEAIVSMISPEAIAKIVAEDRNVCFGS
jgi:hypothetical protein